MKKVFYYNTAGENTGRTYYLNTRIMAFDGGKMERTYYFTEDIRPTCCEMPLGLTAVQDFTNPLPYLISIKEYEKHKERYYFQDSGHISVKIDVKDLEKSQEKEKEIVKHFESVEELKLTDEMIQSIKDDVIPRLKNMYGITSKDEFFEIDEREEEIDWVDIFQVMLGEWNMDFGLKREDYDDDYEYEDAIEEKFEEKYLITGGEEQMKLNLGIEWLQENDW